MDLEHLTGILSQLQALASMAGLAPQSRVYAGEPPVIVRAYSGVFFGYLKSKHGNSVELRDVRQIYSWGSAGLKSMVQTCGDIAVHGVGTDSKVSSVCPGAIIEQVGALFFACPEAERCLLGAKWTK